MRPVAIVQHLADDGPAYFATWLQAQGIPFTLHRMHLHEVLPADIRDCAGLCILGGAMSANDLLPYYPCLLEQIRQAMAADIPVIGHCLGGQLMSRALGGTVQAAEHTEIGWTDLELAHPGGTAWTGTHAPLRQFQWHSESFSIPPGATALLRSQWCANQAFVVNDMHLGMQFHCEVDEAKLQEWLRDGADLMRRTPGPAVQAPQAILRTLQQDLAHSQAIAYSLYTRWAQGLQR
jgi:GMP synthase-like glutamine amidotransferase